MFNLFFRKCFINPLFYAIFITYLFEIIYIINVIVNYIKHNKNIIRKKLCILYNKYIKKYYCIIITFFSLVFIFIFICKIILLIGTKKTYSNFYEKYYVVPTKDIIKFKQKKNLIIINVESFEKTFSNRDFFGRSIIPNLENLEQKGIIFDNYQNGYATTFTAGSIIAQFTGVPTNVIQDKNINSFGDKLNVFNKIYSLGKILKDNGYKTLAMMGTNKNFAGMNNFFKLHGIDEIIGFEDIKNCTRADWGCLDEEVFKIAKEKINNFDRNRPFFIHIQTIDTHAGYKIPNYLFKKKGSFDEYKDAIYNTDFVLYNFIQWMRQQPFFENTVIIIIGDHLRMGNDFKMPEYRNIYNLFLNSVKTKNIHRTFTQIDLFPSILEAMGGELKGHKLGLGVSIFSNEKTLAEIFSNSELENELSKPNKLYNNLW